MKGEKITVLQIVASSRGGGAEHVRCLTKGLDKSRFDTSVAMSENGGHVTARDFEELEIDFLPLNIAEGFPPAELIKLRRFIKERGVKVVHCHGARAALFGRLAASSLLWKRPKIVFSVHGFATVHYSLLRRTVLLWLERILGLFTDVIICVSHAEREAFMKARLVSSDKIQMISYGIELDRFEGVTVDRETQREELGIPIDAFLLTTICRLYRPRDFDTLLGAFKRVSQEVPHARLLIVGDGPLRPKVERLIEELGLDARVILAGVRRDVPEILAATDVFTLTSGGWEGLPLTILEAMASAVPVVATDVGGTGEAVVDGETGFLVPLRNPEMLAQAITAMAQDLSLAQRMGQKGLRRARELFTLRRMVSKITAVYEALVKGAHCPEEPDGL